MWHALNCGGIAGTTTPRRLGSRTRSAGACAGRKSLRGTRSELGMRAMGRRGVSTGAWLPKSFPILEARRFGGASGGYASGFQCVHFRSAAATGPQAAAERQSGAVAAALGCGSHARPRAAARRAARPAAPQALPRGQRRSGRGGVGTALTRPDISPLPPGRQVWPGRCA